MGVVLRGPQGDVVEVPIEEAAQLVDRGYRAEQSGEKAGRLLDVANDETYDGAAGAVNTFLVRGAGAASLGLTDAIMSELGGEDSIRARKAMEARHEGAAIAGTITGAVAPGLLGAGFVPAGAASKLGARIAGAGKASGSLGKAGYAAAGAATEGAIQNAGAYITDVALGDRELSADGFVGAMGKGALFGGAAGGALSVGSSALTAARRLFPKTEITAAAVQKAERAAIDEVAASLDDTASLKATAREQLAQRRALAASTDPEIAAKLDEIKAARQREVIAKAETATVKAERAELAASKAKAGLEKAKTPRAERAAKVADGVAKGAAEPIVMPSAADDADSLLEQQLRGTKAKLDAGATIGDVNAQNPTFRAPGARGMEDEMNAVIAASDPEAAKLVAALDEAEQSTTALDGWLAKYGKGSNVSKAERKMATEDWIANARNKGDGWQTKVPEGEGNIGLARGREMEWRGSEEGRLAAEARINAKVAPAEREAADAAASKLFKNQRGEDIADAVVDARPVVDADSALTSALKSKTDDIDDDIADAATTIGRHESAQADLADALGQYANPRAVQRATALREAQSAAETKAAQAAADTASDIDKAMNTVSLPGVKGAGREGLGRATDAATAWEALHMMGVPMPDPRDIPVVGPVLSLFLKARVIGKTFGRFGGKVVETAETAIASKAASVQQRAYAAIDALVAGTAKGLQKAAPHAGGAAAVLGHVLFDDRADGERKSAPVVKGDLGKLYEARADELARSQQPGAIAAAVRDRVRASDPEIVAAITAAQERKLGFLYEKMPKADAPSVMTGRQWMPAKLSIQTWSKYVEAAEDPAAVLEDAAAGRAVSMEAAETLRTVYPRLYQEAQKRLIQQATTGEAKIPFARRVQLSLLFELPMDSSMDPAYAGYLQSAYQPKPVSQQPAVAPPGQPTIAAPVNLGAQSDPYMR